MDDRALLEAAARAAGIDASWLPDGIEDEGMYLNGARNPDNGRFWNPLTDDGDAFRLAVKIGLQVRAYPIYEEPKHSVLVQKGAVTSDGYQVDVAAVACAYDDSDPYAATRRCIVRAAAAIGQGMKPPEPTLPDSLSDEEHVRGLEGRAS